LQNASHFAGILRNALARRLLERSLGHMFPEAAPMHIRHDGEAAARPNGPVPPAVLAGARVFVAEDNAMIAANIVTLLKRAGVIVVGPVPRLAAALEHVAHADIEAAMLDVDLDGTPVWPAAELLAARGIPFLFCTGYAAHLVVPPHLRDRSVLNKPFMTGQLWAALARLLEGRAGPGEE
jgi:CheY-like chemotaxis protein